MLPAALFKMQRVEEEGGRREDVNSSGMKEKEKANKN